MIASLSLPPDFAEEGEFVVKTRPTAIFDEGAPLCEDEHGNVTKRATVKDLYEIAERNNRRFEEDGVEAPLTIGHTRDGVPETEQPPIVGFAGKYVVGTLKNGKKAIGCVFRYFKDSFQEAMKYPRVSIELWKKEKLIDPIALLGATTPERDLGPLQTSKRGEKLRYSMGSLNLPRSQATYNEPVGGGRMDETVSKVLTEIQQTDVWKELEAMLKKQKKHIESNDRRRVESGPISSEESDAKDDENPEEDGTMPDENELLKAMKKGVKKMLKKYAKKSPALEEPVEGTDDAFEEPGETTEEPATDDAVHDEVDDVDYDPSEMDEPVETPDMTDENPLPAEESLAEPNPGPDLAATPQPPAKFCAQCGSHISNWHHPPHAPYKAAEHSAQMEMPGEPMRYQAAPLVAAAPPGASPSATNTTLPENKKKGINMAEVKERQEVSKFAKLERRIEAMEKENASLREKLSEQEKVARYAKRERDLAQIADVEGYDFDVAEELEEVGDLPEERYTKHLEGIKKKYRKSPVGQRFFPTAHNVEGGPAPKTSSYKDEKVIDFATKNGLTYKQAEQKLNGVA